MKNRKKIHDDWETPKDLLYYIQTKYFGGHSFFDPCPINPDFDGLMIEWERWNYVNPPYDRELKEAFIIKAFYEMLKGKHIVMLLPVSTSTNIFHSIILPYGNIEFLFKRIKFRGINTNGDFVEDKTGQHDSMLVEFMIEEG